MKTYVNCSTTSLNMPPRSKTRTRGYEHRLRMIRRPCGVDCPLFGISRRHHQSRLRGHPSLRKLYWTDSDDRYEWARQNMTASTPMSRQRERSQSAQQLAAVEQRLLSRYRDRANIAEDQVREVVTTFK